MIAKCSPRRSALGVNHVPSRAFTPPRDASPPGRWPTVSLRLKHQHSPGARACFVIRVSFLTDFACAYPSVNDAWIFRVLHKAGLSALLLSFLKMIHIGSTTAVERAGRVRGHFAMARDVRHGCPVSGVPFTMAFDSIFTWLHDAVTPRDLTLSAWLQPIPCAHDGDFADAAPSVRTLMPVITSAFRIIDRDTGVNFKFKSASGFSVGIKHVVLFGFGSSTTVRTLVTWKSPE